jgi:hypothetical protein
VAERPKRQRDLADDIDTLWERVRELEQLCAKHVPGWPRTGRDQLAEMTQEAAEDGTDKLANEFGPPRT